MGGLMVDDAASYWGERLAIREAHGELDEYVPTRAFRVLWRLLTKRGLKVTPQNVASLTAGELLMQENFGRRSLIDIERWLACYGLRLGQGDGIPRFAMSLHSSIPEQHFSSTDGQPWPSDGSMHLLADALDVLHA